MTPTKQTKPKEKLYRINMPSKKPYFTNSKRIKKELEEASKKIPMCEVSWDTKHPKTKPYIERVMEEFDKEFDNLCCGSDFCAGDCAENTAKDIKSFLRKALLQQKREAYKEGYNDGKLDALELASKFKVKRIRKK